MEEPAYDPLRGIRDPGDERVDVALWGTVFLDIIFTGLDSRPTDGTEVMASGMGSCPGGIANLAVATSRLGLRTALSAAFAEDYYGDFCWETLGEEGVRLASSRRYGQWHSPLTVSYAYSGDRSMVTHAHRPPGYADDPVPPPPAARAVIADLGSPEVRDPAGLEWLRGARDEGSLIFADLGWDSTGAWSREMIEPLELCYAFLPNADEAMAYTRTDTPQDALYALADRVPLAVVTNGPHGALAIDSATGEEVSVPSLRVSALDATGSGDVFGAALATGTLAGWRLPDRVAFAALCAGLAVQQFGGSLAAPGWGDIADWWHRVRDGEGRTSYDLAVRRRYGFLEDIVPTVPVGAVHRAQATIARRADVGHHPQA
ncbi:sugar/nucleoside kinase (ribokinase family) [Barrientosiimonas humi]|uniref:Sugar/nucleoside kinase (Ribokinase family) n=1 Tax=Barrientosiimonas humi TaxID=999931 RepID=A0A542XF88_9MICO|nr:PfkB family carbohydrate kinase [Barrientosiimonas humi]TQL34480.1 sugar/nucleoside kinase (ribokinase family) [Barrientosiimonas humi]CAG7574469.1 putative sugar kinase YdjH [Barrientosiimonas humi]